MYHSSLERVEERLPLEITWRAFELRPREVPRSPQDMEAFKAYVAQAWPQIERTAREVFGLELVLGPLGIDTRLAHVGLVAARRWQKETAYLEQVFEAYWRRGQNVGDEEVLMGIAANLELPQEEFAAALRDEAVLNQVLEEQHQARRLGIQGVPATLINGRYRLSGCRPPEELESLLRRVLEGQV